VRHNDSFAFVNLYPHSLQFQHLTARLLSPPTPWFLMPVLLVSLH